jgi:hypothetical protein
MTAPLTHPGDPHYQQGAARWHRDLVSGLWGINIKTDEHLVEDLALHPDGAAWLKPGLTPTELHWRLTQIALYFGYSHDAIPTAPFTPRLIPTPH